MISNHVRAMLTAVVTDDSVTLYNMGLRTFTIVQTASIVINGNSKLLDSTSDYFRITLTKGPLDAQTSLYAPNKAFLTVEITMGDGELILQFDDVILSQLYHTPTKWELLVTNKQLWWIPFLQWPTAG